MNSLRVAVAGKGGAGKTTLSSTLARLFAREGHDVIVVDGDSNPNVATALGIDREHAEAIQPLPMGLVSRNLNGNAALKEPVMDIVRRFGGAAPEPLAGATPRHVDALLLVVEPYYRSFETAKRMAALAAELPIPVVGVVANKLRTPDDASAIAEYCARHSLTLLGELPWSTEVLDADKAEIPVIDY